MEQTMYNPDAPPIDIKAITEADRKHERIKQAKYMQALRLKQFMLKCPALYQNSDESKFPKEWERVKKWRFGEKGMMLVGPTRTCKSRMAWTVIKPQILKGRTVLAYDGIGWGIEVSKNFCNTELTEAWLERMGSIDILFLDDLFKRTLSDVQIEGVFAVFERRMANMKPIICTQNATSEMLRDMMKGNGSKASDIFDPMVQRMKESCDVIVIGGKR